MLSRALDRVRSLKPNVIGKRWSDWKLHRAHPAKHNFSFAFANVLMSPHSTPKKTYTEKNKNKNKQKREYKKQTQKKKQHRKVQIENYMVHMQRSVASLSPVICSQHALSLFIRRRWKDRSGHPPADETHHKPSADLPKPPAEKNDDLPAALIRCNVASGGSL